MKIYNSAGYLPARDYVFQQLRAVEHFAKIPKKQISSVIDAVYDLARIEDSGFSIEYAAIVEKILKWKKGPEMLSVLFSNILQWINSETGVRGAPMEKLNVAECLQMQVTNNAIMQDMLRELMQLEREGGESYLDDEQIQLACAVVANVLFINGTPVSKPELAKIDALLQKLKDSSVFYKNGTSYNMVMSVFNAAVLARYGEQFASFYGDKEVQKLYKDHDDAGKKPAYYRALAFQQRDEYNREMRYIFLEGLPAMTPYEFYQHLQKTGNACSTVCSNMSKCIDTIFEYYSDRAYCTPMSEATLFKTRLQLQRRLRRSRPDSPSGIPGWTAGDLLALPENELWHVILGDLQRQHEEQKQGLLPDDPWVLAARHVHHNPPKNIIALVADMMAACFILSEAEHYEGAHVEHDCKKLCVPYNTMLRFAQIIMELVRAQDANDPAPLLDLVGVFKNGVMSYGFLSRIAGYMRSLKNPSAPTLTGPIADYEWLKSLGEDCRHTELSRCVSDEFVERLYNSDNTLRYKSLDKIAAQLLIGVDRLYGDFFNESYYLQEDMSLEQIIDVFANRIKDLFSFYYSTGERILFLEDAPATRNWRFELSTYSAFERDVREKGYAQAVEEAECQDADQAEVLIQRYKFFHEGMW